MFKRKTEKIKNMIMENLKSDQVLYTSVETPIFTIKSSKYENLSKELLKRGMLAEDCSQYINLSEKYARIRINEKYKEILKILNEVLYLLSHFFFKKNIKDGEYPFWEIDIRKEENRKDNGIPNIEIYNLFGHIHQKCYFEIGENKYYCLGSSGCTHDDYTFYNIVTIENEEIVISEKRIKFDRIKFEKNIQEIEYPEKLEIYERFFL